jgi:DNA-binding MarR family transcriptional regulator
MTTTPAVDAPGNTRWLTPDQQQVWRNYIAMVRLLNEALERQMQTDAGMSMNDYVLLMQLSEAPGRRLRMSELAAGSIFSRSRLSHAVTRLERAGWVQRAECTDDGRGTFAELTDAGFSVLAAAAPGHATTVHDLLFAPIGADGCVALGTILDTVLGSLDTSPPDTSPPDTSPPDTSPPDTSGS